MRLNAIMDGKELKAYQVLSVIWDHVPFDLNLDFVTMLATQLCGMIVWQILLQ